MKFETNGINYVIIPIVSTQIFIPADSMFAVLKTSYSFHSFKDIRKLVIIEMFARF